MAVIVTIHQIITELNGAVLENDKLFNIKTAIFKSKI